MHEKLLKIQSELKAPKGQFNAFGKYKYRSCEDILEAVKPLLKEQGLVLTLSDEILPLGGRNYVKATATLSSENDMQRERTDTSSGIHHYFRPTTLEVTAYAREEETKKGMDGSQITGAASSYARKYALNGLFLIDDAKDSDSTNDHGQEQSNDPKHYPAAPTATNDIEL
jgi:hypothetical protein